MKVGLIICVLLIGFLGFSFAQSNKLQGVYAEAYGPGMAYSVNYDVRFRDKHNGLGFRVGAGYWTYSPESLYRIAVPVQLNYLLGRKKHMLDLGAGATFLNSEGGGSVWGFTSNEGTSICGTISAAYRFQVLPKGIQVRAGATSIFGQGLPVIVPNLSVGYGF